MNTPERSKSDIKPNKFIDLMNGDWFYNYDIKKETIDNEDVFTFIQIRLNEEPTYKKCVEYVIREFISQSEEFDLINSFNKYVIDPVTFNDENNNEDLIKYKNYLSTVSDIKNKIKKDFN